MFGWGSERKPFKRKYNHKLEQHERVDMERRHEKETKTLSSTPNEKFKAKFRIKDPRNAPSRANLFLTAPVSSSENQAWQIIIFSLV